MRARHSENNRRESAWALISSGAVDTTRSTDLFPARFVVPLPTSTRISWHCSCQRTSITSVDKTAREREREREREKEIDGDGPANPTCLASPTLSRGSLFVAFVQSDRDEGTRINDRRTYATRERNGGRKQTDKDRS